MEKYTNEGTPQTPTIHFDPVKGTLLIKGRSIPEDATTFYEPLLKSLKTYSESPKSSTNVHIQLEYFNSSSSIYLLGVFKILEGIQAKGNSVVVNWYFEEEDMLESGEDFQKIVKLTFKMTQVPK